MKPEEKFSKDFGKLINKLTDELMVFFPHYRPSSTFTTLCVVLNRCVREEVERLNKKVALKIYAEKLISEICPHSSIKITTTELEAFNEKVLATNALKDGNPISPNWRGAVTENLPDKLQDIEAFNEEVLRTRRVALPTVEDFIPLVIQSLNTLEFNYSDFRSQDSTVKQFIEFSEGACGTSRIQNLAQHLGRICDNNNYHKREILCSIVLSGLKEGIIEFVN